MNGQRTRPALAYDVGFIVLLGALTMLPPLSIDVSLPGLPAIARALGASPGAMQQSLSVFVFAFGAGQLVFGPLSDRFGRRPVLLAGLTVFVLAGLACTFATNAGMLLVARFVQGIGASAGAMTARATVRDVAPTRERAAVLQAYVGALTTIAPILAPLLGTVLLAAFGWRSLYGVLVIAGLALIAAVLVRFPETAPGVASGVRAAYLRVLRLPRTIALAAFVGCAFGAYFTLISGSAFALVAQMHVATTTFAVAFGLNACALLAGAFLAGRLMSRVGTERLFAAGVALLTLAASAACVLDVLMPSPAGFVATFALFAFAYGIANPSAYAAGLADAGADAGVASGVLGATQMIGGAAGSAIAGALPLAPSAGVGITAAALTFAAAAAYVLSRPRRGLPEL